MVQLLNWGHGYSKASARSAGTPWLSFDVTYILIRCFRCYCCHGNLIFDDFFISQHMKKMIKSQVFMKNTVLKSIWRQNDTHGISSVNPNTCLRVNLNTWIIYALWQGDLSAILRNETGIPVIKTLLTHSLHSALFLT